MKQVECEFAIYLYFELFETIFVIVNIILPSLEAYFEIYWIWLCSWFLIFYLRFPAIPRLLISLPASRQGTLLL